MTAPAPDPAIATSDGTLFPLLRPTAGAVRIEHVAHALSQLCRWTGACREFYSVAQHSVVVSLLVPGPLALQGLLHDASEAYIGDVSTPLKQGLEHLAPGVLDAVEDRIHEAVAERFGTGWPHDPAVKHADAVAAATEARDVMEPFEWQAPMPEPVALRLRGWPPAKAEHEFLKRFAELGGRR